MLLFLSEQCPTRADLSLMGKSPSMLRPCLRLLVRIPALLGRCEILLCKKGVNDCNFSAQRCAADASFCASSSWLSRNILVNCNVSEEQWISGASSMNSIFSIREPLVHTGCMYVHISILYTTTLYTVDELSGACVHRVYSIDPLTTALSNVDILNLFMSLSKTFIGGWNLFWWWELTILKITVIILSQISTGKTYMLQ